jgi:predicted signal transduction protein with EAL and GGDEF domain
MHCSVSVGVALMPHHGEDLWHLVSIADQAMFTAKAANAKNASNDPTDLVEVAIAS